MRSLIGARSYTITFKTGGGSYVNMRTKEIVVDPLMADGWGGTTLRMLEQLQFRISRTMARHESGHMLFTDDYTVTGRLHAWLTNTLED